VPGENLGIKLDIVTFTVPTVFVVAEQFMHQVWLVFRNAEFFEWNLDPS
jgi:hypothetical protein